MSSWNLQMTNFLKEMFGVNLINTIFCKHKRDSKENNRSNTVFQRIQAYWYWVSYLENWLKYLFRVLKVLTPYNLSYVTKTMLIRYTAVKFYISYSLVLKAERATFYDMALENLNFQITMTSKLLFYYNGRNSQG